MRPECSVRSSSSSTGTARRVGQRKRRLDELVDHGPVFLRRSTVKPVTQQQYQRAADSLQYETSRDLRSLIATVLDEELARYKETL